MKLFFDGPTATFRFIFLLVIQNVSNLQALIFTSVIDPLYNMSWKNNLSKAENRSRGKCDKEAHPNPLQKVMQV